MSVQSIKDAVVAFQEETARDCIEDIHFAWTGGCDDDRWAIQLIEVRFGLPSTVSPTPHPGAAFQERLAALRRRGGQ